MINLNLNLSKLASNTIRILAAEGVQKANSGHPGMPMGMADCAFILWNHFLKFNPKNPEWLGRDRFILSPGHGSMLLYSLLYLYGFDLSIDDLKNFRQWGSKTPGHPEYAYPKGVETTTGPLGQGFANGIGMAIAAKMFAARFNTENFNLFGTHKIYAIVSDGDLMEGISSEAASLAGHLNLDNIIYIYDSNQITIEGRTNLTFSENIEEKFKAFGWDILKIDGHNHQEIFNALIVSSEYQNKPTLIIANTIIGFGSPNKKDTPGVHGSPLGPDELKLTKENLGFDSTKEFEVPSEVREAINLRLAELENKYNVWQKNFSEWQKKYPEKANELDNFLHYKIPNNLEEELIAVVPKESKATRVLSGKVMQKIAELIPNFIGGSADLKPSTNTYLDKFDEIKADDFRGRNFHFGIREHAMGSINNGIALYGGFIPFGSTFLVFSDYMRPAIRLAAIMHLRNIFVFTHDSIFVGEDGPTHQPVEHISALRTIPNLQVLRPADGIETALCWALAVKTKNKPTAILLTRQNVTPIERDNNFSNHLINKGGYVISKEKDIQPAVAIIASGSEVGCSLDAQKLLEEKGIATRVISVPCKELFEQQDENYLKTVLPESLKLIVIVEAGIGFGWHSFFNIPNIKIVLDDFGKSAPYKLLAEKFGFTGDNIAKEIIKFFSLG